jgi:hypothetical protein
MEMLAKEGWRRKVGEGRLEKEGWRRRSSLYDQAKASQKAVKAERRVGMFAAYYQRKKLTHHDSQASSAAYSTHKANNQTRCEN